jgi:GTP-binding protein LepA
MNNLRNFCIIAHIDHGKSTLSDRLLQATNTISEREMKEQILDSMDLERERGITIKMQAVRMRYTAQNQKEYIFNLIDTPGHVDFSYEVSRSLAACEGALLVIDAAQGIEAQTLANFYLALEQDLTIIPIINKIDLTSAEPERIKAEINEVLGFRSEEIILCSAKTGQGISEILEEIAHKIPPPKPLPENQLKALIFDAHYDPYRGVVNYIRLFSGSIHKNEKIQMMSTGHKFEVLELGFFKPKMTPINQLQSGEVGYLISNIKNIEEASIGDTITSSTNPAQTPLKGYTKAKPMVFCGFYPVDSEEYSALKDALEKLKLNDASLNFIPETSDALGFGFRCGFLGLLHLEIIKERIEREFGIELIATSPNVTYEVTTTKGEVVLLENPNKMPPVTQIELMKEPFMELSIITPNSYIGAVMTLAKDHRGEYKKTEYIDPERQMLVFAIPLNEIIANFFDKLKSHTKGYASMDYNFLGYQPSKLVKVNILINGEIVDALSFISEDSKARFKARQITSKLKEQIPRQLYQVAIQGAIGGKIICRETISAIKKNVTAKCYGGDITRKRKLLEKQKEGKKKMKSIGSIRVPKEAFFAILKIQD